MDYGILLYCITNSEVEGLSDVPSMDGINSIYAIKYGDIYGIVSNVDMDKYGEENLKKNSEDIKWITNNAQRFMNVLLQITARAGIIPMKFLTIFNSPDRVIERLKENHDEFLKKLQLLKEHEEWSVKIYCRSKFFKENCMGDEIKKFENELIGKPKGAAFFLKKKFENQMDDKAQDKILNIGNQIIETLRTHAAGTVFNKLLTSELSGRPEQMVLNCAFLLETDCKELFLKSINELRNEYECKGFIIDCTGPWPPYNFC